MFSRSTGCSIPVTQKQKPENRLKVPTAPQKPRGRGRRRKQAAFQHSATYRRPELCRLRRVSPKESNAKSLLREQFSFRVTVPVCTAAHHTREATCALQHTSSCNGEQIFLLPYPSFNQQHPAPRLRRQVPRSSGRREAACSSCCPAQAVTELTVPPELLFYQHGWFKAAEKTREEH